MQLKPEALDADSNDLAEQWCAVTGSPGLANPSCPL
jgi:hypothetical protein